jgi:hypothetical protein
MFVLTVKISWLRLRFLSLVSTSMSTPKSLDQEGLKVSLDSWENLVTFKILVSMCQEILISILICLDCRDPKAYFLPRRKTSKTLQMEIYLSQNIMNLTLFPFFYILIKYSFLLTSIQQKLCLKYSNDQLVLSPGILGGPVQLIFISIFWITSLSYNSSF